MYSNRCSFQELLHRRQDFLYQGERSLSLVLKVLCFQVQKEFSARLFLILQDQFCCVRKLFLLLYKAEHFRFCFRILKGRLNNETEPFPANESDLFRRNFFHRLKTFHRPRFSGKMKDKLHFLHIRREQDKRLLRQL